MEPVSRLVFLSFTDLSDTRADAATPPLSYAESPRGIWGGLIHGVAYFRNFTVITTLLRLKQPNRYYVSFMQTGFCPPAFITLGDSLSPDRPETRAKYETVFLCLNN